MTIVFQDRKYIIPTGYATLSWGDYKRLSKTKNNLELVSVLIGMPVDKLRCCTDVDGYEKILKCLDFFKVPIGQEPFGELVTIDGKAIAVPSTFDAIELQQYEDIKLIVETEPDEILKMEKVVTIGSMKGSQKEYDYGKLDAMLTILDGCTVESVVGTAYFFFRRLGGWKSGMLVAASNLIIRRTKRWLVSMS